mmetsp:Transcript_19936/g.70533  ORF Transcript_19936/g.70533 Transcript_19936/m.70533 type:complete len:319 (-) Transcript_19936:378-1334(-)
MKREWVTLLVATSRCVSMSCVRQCDRLLVSFISVAPVVRSSTAATSRMASSGSSTGSSVAPTMRCRASTYAGLRPCRRSSGPPQCSSTMQPVSTPRTSPAASFARRPSSAASAVRTSTPCSGRTPPDACARLHRPGGPKIRCVLPLPVWPNARKLTSTPARKAATSGGISAPYVASWSASGPRTTSGKSKSRPARLPSASPMVTTPAASSHLLTRLSAATPSPMRSADTGLMRTATIAGRYTRPSMSSGWPRQPALVGGPLALADARDAPAAPPLVPTLRVGPGLPSSGNPSSTSSASSCLPRSPGSATASIARGSGR